MQKVWCFDLWFTLIEPESFEGGTYQDVLVEAGVNRKAIFPFVRDFCMTRRYSYFEIANLVCANFCVTDEGVIEKVRNAWKVENQKVHWIGNAQKILGSIAKTGDPLILITNTTFVGWQDVDQLLGVAHHFSKLFLSWEQKLTKPNPKVFNRVMSWFPEVTADHFIMIGDNFEHDLAIPKKLGWKTLLVEGGVDYVLD